MRNRLYGLHVVAGPGWRGPPFLIGLPHYSTWTKILIGKIIYTYICKYIYKYKHIQKLQNLQQIQKHRRTRGPTHQRTDAPELWRCQSSSAAADSAASTAAAACTRDTAPGVRSKMFGVFGHVAGVRICLVFIPSLCINWIWTFVPLEGHIVQTIQNVNYTTHEHLR